MSLLIKNVLLDGKETDDYVENNLIKEIGKKLEADKVIDGKHKAIIPSFVNGHTHSAMTLLRGYADDMMLQEWLRELGIPAYSRPMAFGALIQQVKVKRDFDAFILGYGRLSLDPDYLRNFFISRNNKKRGWNMSGYNNPNFDRIADESADTMNREKRRALIWEMQKIILTDVPYIPLYNPKLVEATRKGRFTGWVGYTLG